MQSRALPLPLAVPLAVALTAVPLSGSGTGSHSGSGSLALALPVSECHWHCQCQCHSGCSAALRVRLAASSTCQEVATRRYCRRRDSDCSSDSQALAVPLAVALPHSRGGAALAVTVAVPLSVLAVNFNLKLTSLEGPPWPAAARRLWQALAGGGGRAGPAAGGQTDRRAT